MTKIEKLMGQMPVGIDAGIICGDENRRYFLDFGSSAGTIFVTREKAFFIIDFRYIEAAKKIVKGVEIILQDKLDDQLKDLVAQNGIKTVGVENDYLSISRMQELKSTVSPAQLELGNEFNDAILALRRIKDAGEVRRIREAQRLTDETFTYILDRIQAGRTEKEVALDMEYFMRKHGADAVSFDFIVVAGKKSSMPHGVPGNNIIRKGDFVTMDFGALVDGYHSDMTRTVAVGEASEKQRQVYNTVLEAQLKALGAIKAGIPCFDIDKVARDIIYGAGYEGKFGHGLGHSVGIEIHEEPRFSMISKDIAEAGIVMTVEPGIYLEDEFGVRIEDMGQVTETGFDNFTASRKDLIIL